MLLFLFLRMAAETPCVGLSLSQSLEADNLADITSAGHMLRARTVAGFTAMSIFACQPEVDSTLESLLVNFFVTSFASIGPNVLRPRRSSWLIFRPICSSGGAH